ERKLYGPSGRRQTAPRTQMAATDDDLENDRYVARVASLHIDLQVRLRAQQRRIERAHAVAADIIAVPWFVVVTRRAAERRHDAVEVVPVFQPHMLVDKLKPAQFPLVGRGHGAGLRSLLEIVVVVVVARMERSDIRDGLQRMRSHPGFRYAHPGYLLLPLLQQLVALPGELLQIVARME